MKLTKIDKIHLTYLMVILFLIIFFMIHNQNTIDECNLFYQLCNVKDSQLTFLNISQMTN